MKTEHLLIIRFSAMGDVAMMVPVVYSLAKQYPNIRISVLSRPFAANFFDKLAPNVDFMSADLNNEYKNLRGLNKLYRRLTAKRFTAIADFHDTLRSKYLRTRFSLDRFKVAHIDKHRADRRRLTAKRNKELTPLQTSFQNYADVLAKLGYPIEIDFTSIFPRQDGTMPDLPDGIEAKNMEERWIGIAPFAAHKGKVYPLEKMEKTIEMIQTKYENTRIFLFGGRKEEKEQLSVWAEKYDRCVSVPTLLNTLQEELLLMYHLDVMISMDSANMHLASLVNTPVISVWGATHPFAGFMGWNQSADLAVQTDLTCRPCSIYGNKPCWRNDYACLNEIKPEQIINKLDEVIHKNSK